MVSIWRKQSDGNPSRGRVVRSGYRAFFTEPSEAEASHSTPPGFLGRLMQTGEQMVYAVTLLLPNTVVTDLLPGKVALAGLGMC